MSTVLAGHGVQLGELVTFQLSGKEEVGTVAELDGWVARIRSPDGSVHERYIWRIRRGEDAPRTIHSRRQIRR